MTPNLTRRQWLASLAATAACASPEPQPEAVAEPAPAHPVGLNLYTVRSILPEDPERVLRELASIGCRYVEARLAQVENHLALLAELDMPWVHWMVETPLVTGAWEAWDAVSKARGGSPAERRTLDAVIETAAGHGVKNLGISFTLPAEREGPDGWERLAEQCNRAGEACRVAGLGFYFHNHAEEFVGAPGERPFDRLLAALDPALVKFEIDVFWVSIAGADPAAAIRQASGRVASLHLKDKAADTPNVTSTMGAPLEATREVGAGVLDWPAILAAAEEAGVERRFIEQDVTPGDPLESVRQSYAFLASRGARP